MYLHKINRNIDVSEKLLLLYNNLFIINLHARVA